MILNSDVKGFIVNAQYKSPKIKEPKDCTLRVMSEFHAKDIQSSVVASIRNEQNGQIILLTKTNLCALSDVLKELEGRK